MEFRENAARVEEVNCSFEQALALMENREKPIIFRSLIAHWPAVVAAKTSSEALASYLAGFYSGRPVTVVVGDPSASGRVFYNTAMDGFNYKVAQADLSVVLHELLSPKTAINKAAYYVGSTDVDVFFPGFKEQNNLKIPGADPVVGAWLGNQSRIAAHYDTPNNLAGVVSGRRVFSLFPPEQLENLYVGPLEFNPAGQPISLVDFYHIDHERFPKFSTALKAMSVAYLEPGDVLYIPSMWWHHVEALDNFNLLINFWWKETPRYLGVPLEALMHSIFSIRDLTPAERAAWKNIFDYYVFNPEVDNFSHIPENAKGVLKKIDSGYAKQLRTMLQSRLNR